MVVNFPINWVHGLRDGYLINWISEVWEWLPRVFALVFLFGCIAFFATNLYLTLKLRPRKYEIKWKIAQAAPEKLRDRALLAMETNMSWVFGSSCSYIWFLYPIIRFFGRVSSDEIVAWRKEIKTILGATYRIYWCSAMLFNLTSFGIAIILINIYLLPALSNG